MLTVERWSWRQRLRRLHFTHWWYLRVRDRLECVRCHATKPGC